MSQSEYVTPEAVAEAYGVDAETVRRWCRHGGIEGAFKAGKLWRIPRRYLAGDIPIDLPKNGGGGEREEKGGRDVE